MTAAPPPSPKPSSPSWLTALLNANAATVVLLITIAGLVFGLVQSRNAARTNGLRADSLAAVADTAKGDRSAALKRIAQAELHADSLDQRLKLAPKVKIVAAIPLPPVHDTVHDTVKIVAAADGSDSVRTGHFVDRHAPITATVDVALPKVGLGTMVLDAKLDTLRVDARISCGSATGGIHSAYAVLSSSMGPVGLQQVSADPNVCNPPPAFAMPHSLPAWTLPAAAVIGIILGRIL